MLRFQLFLIAIQLLNPVYSMLESRIKAGTTNAIDQTWLQWSTQTYGS